MRCRQRRLQSRVDGRRVRTASIPELISGKAVASARIVAPKTTPLIPARSASSLPVTSSTTPATRVTTDAEPNVATTRTVDCFARAAPAAVRTRRCGRPGWAPCGTIFHMGFDRARLRTQTPPTQITTIAGDAGLSRPAMATDAGSRAPMATAATVRITSSPSSTGISDPQRYVSGLSVKRSQITSTIVAVAIPPIRLPAARSRWPDAAAETVIASSGRLPAMASNTIPPSASPMPSRVSSSSVDFES